MQRDIFLITCVWENQVFVEMWCQLAGPSKSSDICIQIWMNKWITDWCVPYTHTSVAPMCTPNEGITVNILCCQLANLCQFWSKIDDPWDQCKSYEKILVGGLGGPGLFKWCQTPKPPPGLRSHTFLPIFLSARMFTVLARVCLSRQTVKLINKASKLVYALWTSMLEESVFKRVLYLMRILSKSFY